jgi:hypothetical protein
LARNSVDFSSDSCCLRVSLCDRLSANLWSTTARDLSNSVVRAANRLCNESRSFMLVSFVLKKRKRLTTELGLGLR